MHINRCSDDSQKCAKNDCMKYSKKYKTTTDISYKIQKCIEYYKM